MFGARCPSAGSGITPAHTLADPPLWVNDWPDLRVPCIDAAGPLTAHSAVTRFERRPALIDGANHGGSPPVRRPFTLDDCAGAAADVLDHLGIGEPVDWLGDA